MASTMRPVHYLLLFVATLVWVFGSSDGYGGWFAGALVLLVILGNYLISTNPSTNAILKGRNLLGQVAIVTGSTAGIGLATARALARANVYVIIGARSETKAADAIYAIKAKQPNALVKSLPLDLADSKSIAEFVRQFNELNLPLNLLILNAGGVGGSDCTRDGIETTLGVTHFGHYALTQLLLPKLLEHTDASGTLRSPAKPRVVVVSSHSHLTGTQVAHKELLRWAAIDKKDRPKMGLMKLYEHAKLANVLFIRELDRRYGRRIETACLHPGSMMQTEITRQNILFRLAFFLGTVSSKSLDQGAATTIFCAVDKSVADRGAQYYADCEVFKKPSYVTADLPGEKAGNDAVQMESLWNDSHIRFRELFPGAAAE